MYLKAFTFMKFNFKGFQTVTKEFNSTNFQVSHSKLDFENNKKIAEYWKKNCRLVEIKILESQNLKLWSQQ